jgi:hypothetical protein
MRSLLVAAWFVAIGTPAIALADGRALAIDRIQDLTLVGARAESVVYRG